MDLGGFGTGNSLADDERPVISGQLDKQTWFDGLTDYVNSMKEICPNYNHHPSVEWLSFGFSMISLGQERTAATTPKQGSLAVVGRGRGDLVSPPVSNMQRRLDTHTHRQLAQELSSRQTRLIQHEKDRKFHVQAFSNRAAQFHAGDLFHIETCAMDISQYAKVLAPH